jgi:hypothetical protein
MGDFVEASGATLSKHRSRCVLDIVAKVWYTVYSKSDWAYHDLAIL